MGNNYLTLKWGILKAWNVNGKELTKLGDSK